MSFYDRIFKPRRYTLPSGAVRTGLFGTTYGGVVKDFTIKGSITLSAGNKGDNSGIGGAIGATKYGTAVSGVTSYVNISNTSANALVHVGGVVGELYSSTAKQCLYFGSINLQNASDSIGGVVGYITVPISAPSKQPRQALMWAVCWDT